MINLNKPYNYKLEFSKIGNKFLPSMYSNEFGYFEKITYDKKGRIKRLKTPSGSEVWSYYDCGNVKSHQYSNGVTEFWVYKPNGDLDNYHNTLGLMIGYKSPLELISNENDACVISNAFTFDRCLTSRNDRIVLRFNTHMDWSFLESNNYPGSVLINLLHEKEYDEIVLGDPLLVRATEVAKCYACGTVKPHDPLNYRYDINIDINGIVMEGKRVNNGYIEIRTVKKSPTETIISDRTVRKKLPSTILSDKIVIPEPGRQYVYLGGDDIDPLPSGCSYHKKHFILCDDIDNMWYEDEWYDDILDPYYNYKDSLI